MTEPSWDFFEREVNVLLADFFIKIVLKGQFVGFILKIMV
jgi:ligand-binding sensor protein